MDKIKNPFSPGVGSPQLEMAGRDVIRNRLGYRTGDIADRLNVKINTLGPVRASLIKKGMVFSLSDGDMAFTGPLFDEFMRSAMPEFDVYADDRCPGSPPHLIYADL